MREIDAQLLTKNIKEMCIEANHYLSDDMKKVFDNARNNEKSPLGKQIFHTCLRHNPRHDSADFSHIFSLECVLSEFIQDVAGDK